MSHGPVSRNTRAFLVSIHPRATRARETRVQCHTAAGIETWDSNKSLSVSLSWSPFSALSVSATLADTRRIATRRNFDTKTWSGPSPADSPAIMKHKGENFTQHTIRHETINWVSNYSARSELCDILARLKSFPRVVLIMLICGVLLQVPRVFGIISLPAVQGSPGLARLRQAHHSLTRIQINKHINIRNYRSG